MMKRFFCAGNGYGEARGSDEREIRIGWRQVWVSPERLGENGSVQIRDVVRGPFKTPRLLKMRPFLAAAPKNEVIDAIPDRKHTLRRGIPDTWSEYLAVKGHCGSRDMKLLRENRIPCCTRCHVTGIMWKRLGVPLIQGVPDPSRDSPFFSSKSKGRVLDPRIGEEMGENIERPILVPCDRGRDKKIHSVENRGRKSGNMTKDAKGDEENRSYIEYDKIRKYGYKDSLKFEKGNGSVLQDKLDASHVADHKQGMGRRLNGDSNKNAYTVKSMALHSRSYDEGFGKAEKRKGGPQVLLHPNDLEGNKARQVRIGDMQYIGELSTSEETKKNSTGLVSIRHKGAKNGTGVQVPGPRRRRIRRKRCRQRSGIEKQNDSMAEHGRSYEKGGEPKARETQVQGEDRSALLKGKSGDSKCKDEVTRIVERTMDAIPFQPRRNRRTASFSNIEKCLEDKACQVCRSCGRICERSTLVRKCHDTTDCGCALRISQSTVPRMDYISRRADQSERIDASKLVLCETCENIHGRNHSWKSFTDLRSAECPASVAKSPNSRAANNRHEELYEKTKRKICFCVERAKRTILSSNFLGGEKGASRKKAGLELRSETGSTRQTSLICCRCDCPYLKFVFDNHADEYSSKGNDKPGKKAKVFKSKYRAAKGTASQRVEKLDAAFNSENRVCTRTGNKMCVSERVNERFLRSKNVNSAHNLKTRKNPASKGKTRLESVNPRIHFHSPRLPVNVNDHSTASRKNKIRNVAQVNQYKSSSKRTSSTDKQLYPFSDNSCKENSRNLVESKTANKDQNCSSTENENCTRMCVENKLYTYACVNGSFIDSKDSFEEEEPTRMPTLPWKNDDQKDRLNHKNRYTVTSCSNSKKTILPDTDYFVRDLTNYSRTPSGHKIDSRTRKYNKVISSEIAKFPPKTTRKNRAVCWITRKIDCQKENVRKIDDCLQLKEKIDERKREKRYSRHVRSNDREENQSDSGERADISDFSEDLNVNVTTTGDRSLVALETPIERSNVKSGLRGKDREPEEYRRTVNKDSTMYRRRKNGDDDERSLTPETDERSKHFLNRVTVNESSESVVFTNHKECKKHSVKDFHGLSGCLLDILQSTNVFVDPKFHHQGVKKEGTIRSMRTTRIEDDEKNDLSYFFLNDRLRSKKESVSHTLHDRDVKESQSIMSMHIARSEDGKDTPRNLPSLLLGDRSRSKKENGTSELYQRRLKKQESIGSMQEERLRDEQEVLDILSGCLLDDESRNKNKTADLQKQNRGNKKSKSIRLTDRIRIKDDGEVLEVLSSSFFYDTPRNKKKAKDFAQLSSIMNHDQTDGLEKKGSQERLSSGVDKVKNIHKACDSHSGSPYSSSKIADFRRTRSPCIFSRTAKNDDGLFMHNENVESSSVLTDVELCEVESFAENREFVGTDVTNDVDALNESKANTFAGNDVIEENTDHSSVVSALLPNPRPISIRDRGFRDREILEAWTDVQVTKEKPYLKDANLASDLEYLRNFLIGKTVEKGSTIEETGFDERTGKKIALNKNGDYLNGVKWRQENSMQGIEYSKSSCRN